LLKVKKRKEWQKKNKFFLLFFFFTFSLTFSQTVDSLKTYEIKEIIVLGRRYSIDQSEFPYEKGRLSELLELGGFSIIRKGVFLAQDIYAEGMKKGDYTIVIDGERYHNACPNRMDAPVTRVNPIEVRSINLVKSSSNLQSGLGGVIVINRSLPSDNFKFSSNLSQLIGNSNETDLSFLAEKSRQRISIRYVQGLPYKDGDNRTFKDLYSYKENKKFQFGEASLTGKLSDFMYSGSLMYSENISFPYLQMDEIKSVVYNASLDYSGYKLYVNYTDHLMNNSLRTGNMFMETKAKNLTVGFVSKNVEAYYRW
jgi:iron complex outermembrane receptor protein